MYKFFLIINIIFSIIFFISMIYNFVIGINNHDTYYLLLAIVDCIFLQLNIKDVKKDIDNISNM